MSKKGNDQDKPQDDGHIHIQENILQFRLEATRDAQKMSRLSFLISTIVAMGIIIATWNAYYCWNVHFALNEKFPESKVTEEVQKKVICEWVESSSISVPLLGIKVGIFDGPVFGSLALLIISIWFFLNIRRENRSIGFLLKDMADSETDPKTHRWLYYGIVTDMLFTNISKKDVPIEEINGTAERYRPDTFMRMSFKILLFLPTIAILFLIISDILTVYILPAYYRFPHDPLFEYFELRDAVKLIFMDGIAFFLLVIITAISRRVLTYVEGTSKVLKDYCKKYAMKSGNTSQ